MGSLTLVVLCFFGVGIGIWWSEQGWTMCVRDLGAISGLSLVAEDLNLGTTFSLLPLAVTCTGG